MKKKGNNNNSNSNTNNNNTNLNTNTNNNNVNITPTSPSNTNQQYQIFSFPIWEKVYLDLKELKDQEDFFSNSMSIQCSNLIYIFPKNKLPSGKRSYYAIFSTDNESIVINETDIDCFYPIYDQASNSKVIYLFSYEDNYMSDYRYSLVEYNTETKSFSYIQHKGVPPKARSESFTAFILGGKIFFFGGLPMFPGDNSGIHLYSFNIKESEWNIENYIGVYHNDNQNLPYTANTINVVAMPISKEKVLLIGGKYFDDVFYSNVTSHRMQNAKESNEIVEFNYITLTFSKKPLVNYFTSDIKFNHHSAAYNNKDSVYIHNKGNLYSYDIQLGEISMYKPILFSPEELSSSSSLFISNSNSNSNLILIGKWKCYEDCYIFKTSIDNLIPKWNSNKLISYEQLLNVKECSDMICSFNNGDKTKEVYLNKKILFNFSLALKNLIVDWSQNSNVYIFNDINYVSMYNTLKFIYSNFNESMNDIDYEIMNEMFYIILRYRAKSLLNIIVDHIQLTNENAVAYYQLAVKYNLDWFIKATTKFISENMQNGLVMNENCELKKMLYENYFCLHKVYVQANIIGIDIKNVSQMTLTTDKVSEIKELSKEGKMCYCLLCKKVFKNISS